MRNSTSKATGGRKAPADRKATGSKATGSKAPADKAPERKDRTETSPEDVEAAVLKATETGDTGDIAAAVMAMLHLPAGSLTPTHRAYLAEHGGAVYDGWQSLVDSTAKLAQTRDSLAAKLSDTTTALKSATEAQNERTATLIVHAWRTIDVHRLMRQNAYCAKYDVAKSDVSRWQKVGRYAAAMGVSSPARLVTLLQGVNKYGPAVEQAMAKGTVDKPVKFDTVARAIADAKAVAKARKSGGTGTPAVSTEQEVIRDLGRLVARMKLVNTHRPPGVLPDPDGGSAYSLLREALSLLGAYVDREYPGAFGPGVKHPVMTAAYAPATVTPLASRGVKRQPANPKRLPAPAAQRKATASKRKAS